MSRIHEDESHWAELAEPERRARRRFRICLATSIPVYLALAAASLRWLPEHRFVAAIFVYFAAHSAAYLLRHLLRGNNDPDA